MVNWTNVTSPADLLSVANTSVGGWFWTAMLFLVWFITSLLLMNFGVEKAIITSSLICLIVSMFLSYMNLVAWTWCLFFVGVLIFTFLYIMWSKRD